MRLKHYFFISLAVIVLDQLVKLLIFSTMEIGDEFSVLGNWFKIHYITNPGMAFGIEIAGDYGKIILSLFRIGAMILIAYYMRKLYLKNSPQGLLLCMALIFGGAIGNLVDSIFYGVFLGLIAPNSPMAWFHGEVIDMFFIDITKGFYPEWIPIIGGDYYSFWPVFNIADAAIFVAVIVIIIYQKKYFAEEKFEESKEEETKETKSEITA